MREPDDFNDDFEYAEQDDIDSYDAYEDEKLNTEERNSLMKNSIGYNMLSNATDEQKDDIEFFAALYEVYEMNFDYIMSSASDRLSDLYDVGNAYLSPLFKFEGDKYNYILSMIREWDRTTNKREIYGYKNILSKVYKMPSQYIKYSLKYVYTRDEYSGSSFVDKLKGFVNKVKSNSNNDEKLNLAERNLLLKKYMDLTNGSSGQILKWLINYNQKAAIQANEDNFDEDLDAEGISKINEDNIKIMCYLDAIDIIVSKPRAELYKSDMEMFDRIMKKLDVYIDLGVRQKQFVEEHEDFEQ